MCYFIHAHFLIADAMQMIQLVAKPIAVLTFSGLSTPLTTTFTYFGAMMGINTTDIYG
jgi:hypothetical protein